jgi:hypothetical protein
LLKLVILTTGGEFSFLQDCNTRRVSDIPIQNPIFLSVKAGKTEGFCGYIGCVLNLIYQI